MALPSSYTEATLKTYMIASLGALSTTLGLAESDMAEPVNDVLVTYGVASIADATDVPKLRALAKVQALRRAQTVASGWIDFSADGASFSRSRVMDSLKALLTQAETDAAQYDGSYAILTGTLTYADNPYPFNDDDESEYDG